MLCIHNERLVCLHVCLCVCLCVRVRPSRLHLLLQTVHLLGGPSTAQTQTHTQVKTQVNRQWAPLECQSHTQSSAKLHTEKCQCPVAGSRPAFPSPALQNPAQIFPGSDTSLALGSFLHVERNSKSTTRTALKWEWISRSGNADCWAFLEEQKCIDLYKSVEVMFHFTVVLVSGAHLPHLLLRNKESGVSRQWKRQRLIKHE